MLLALLSSHHQTENKGGGGGGNQQKSMSILPPPPFSFQNWILVSFENWGNTLISTPLLTLKNVACINVHTLGSPLLKEKTPYYSPNPKIVLFEP